MVFGQKYISKIDSLSAEADVEKIIHSFNKDYQKFELKPISEVGSDYSASGISKRFADSLGIDKSFYKTDFDNNGFTDLLVIG